VCYNHLFPFFYFYPILVIFPVLSCSASMLNIWASFHFHLRRFSYLVRLPVIFAGLQTWISLSFFDLSQPFLCVLWHFTVPDRKVLSDKIYSKFIATFLFKQKASLFQKEAKYYLSSVFKRSVFWFIRCALVGYT